MYLTSACNKPPINIASYVVLTPFCFSSERAEAKLHACTSCWDTNTTEGFPMPYPKVSLNLSVLCPLLFLWNIPLLQRKWMW